MATLVVATLVGIVMAGASPASADPLPLGTFKIQTSTGQCATVTSGSFTLTAKDCGLVNLDQQYTYLPITQQILSVSRVGNCLAVTLSSIRALPCDTASAQQRFSREGPDASGRYWIIGTGAAGQRICVRANDQVAINFQNCPSGDPVQDTLLFTFPLV